MHCIIFPFSFLPFLWLGRELGFFHGSLPASLLNSVLVGAGVLICSLHSVLTQVKGYEVLSEVEVFLENQQALGKTYWNIFSHVGFLDY